LNLISKWRGFAKFDFDSARYQPPVGGSQLVQRMYRVLHGHDPNDDLTRYLDRAIAALILVSVTFDLLIDVESTNFLFMLVSQGVVA
jgi:hypothetical protein